MELSRNPISNLTPSPEASNPVVLLVLQNKSDRELVRNFLPDNFDVQYAYNIGYRDFDLCLVDKSSLQQHKSKLAATKEDESPAFLPVLLLVKSEGNLQTHHIGWDFADEIISIPTSPAILRSRISLLLRQRMYSQKLEEQQQKLKEKNGQLNIFKKVFQATNNGVTITNYGEEDNPIVYANTAFEEITGYSEKEVQGKNWRFLQEDDRNQPGVKSIRNSIQNGESDRQLIRNYKKDGTPFWNELSVAPVKDSQGNITHYVGIQNDMTEIIEANKKLQYEKKYIQAIIESLPGFFYMLDRDLNYKKWNNAMSEVTGYSDSEIAGMSPLTFFPETAHEYVTSSIQKIFENGHATMEAPIQTKSGETFDYFFFARKVTLDDEDFIIGSAVDISDRINMEKELKKSLREKEVLLQEIHHRVKNNLAVVSGMLQIQRYKSDNPTIDNLLQDSESRIKTMALIHEKLYKSESLSSISFNHYLRDLIRSIDESIAENKQIKLTIDCADIQLNVNQAVPAALIVNEILNNSVKHAFFGDQKGIISISVHLQDKNLTVQINDNGRGLPEDFKLADQSSMGFTIVRTLLKQLHARYEFNSGPGTCFSFTFPLRDIKGSSSSL